MFNRLLAMPWAPHLGNSTPINTCNHSAMPLAPHLGAQNPTMPLSYIDPSRFLLLSRYPHLQSLLTLAMLGEGDITNGIVKMDKALGAAEEMFLKSGASFACKKDLGKMVELWAAQWGCRETRDG